MWIKGKTLFKCVYGRLWIFFYISKKIGYQFCNCSKTFYEQKSSVHLVLGATNWPRSCFSEDNKIIIYSWLFLAVPETTLFSSVLSQSKSPDVYKHIEIVSKLLTVSLATEALIFAQKFFRVIKCRIQTFNNDSESTFFFFSFESVKKNNSILVKTPWHL